MSDIAAALGRLPQHLLASSEVAALESMTFLENLEIQADGLILVTSVLDGRIWAITPEGEKSVLAQVDGRLASVASRSGGGWLAFGTAIGGTTCVFAVEPDGSSRPWMDLPDCMFPNGVQRLTDTIYLLVDSANGRIWAIDYAARTCAVWLEHPLLAPVSGVPIPGLNGIKLFGGKLYGTNSAQGLFVEIDVDGAIASGEPQVVGTGLPADDFAFDQSGAAYFTTHPFNCVIRRDVDGTLTRVAGPDEGVVGCTACRFDVRPGHESDLIVVTDGGLFHPPIGGVQEARIVRLSTATKGAPVDPLLC